MDSFSSELSDGQLPGLSISLVSYGSDLDASVDDSTPNLKTKTLNSVSDAETTIGNKWSSLDETTTTSVHQRALQLLCSGLTEVKKKELELALAEATAAQGEYLESREVFRALERVIQSQSETLPQHTRDSAQKLWRRQELKQYVGTAKGAGLLGLSEEHLWADCPQKLSETDHKIVCLAVKGQLIQTASKLKQSEMSKQEILNKISNNVSNTGPKAESDHTIRLSALRAKLNNELNKYYKLLITIDSLLETIVQMRTNKMSEICLKIIEGFEAKAQLLKQQARLINTDIQSAIYTEDTNVVLAMQYLEKDLDSLLSEMDMELSQSKGSLAAYDRVMCREYNNILEEYCYILKQIKSTNYVLNEVKKF